MKRGDIITVAVSGDFGKPRPAVIVQNDDLDGIGTTLVAMITTDDNLVAAFRLRVARSAANGLRFDSIVMLDKISVVWRAKCGPVIGRLSTDQMVEMDTSLALVLSLAR
jgi:mRNA interferase MazF